MLAGLHALAAIFITTSPRTVHCAALGAAELLLGIRCAVPWELLWPITSFVNYGLVTRVGPIKYPPPAAGSSTVAGLMLRCGGTGAAGVLAHFTARPPPAERVAHHLRRTPFAPAALAVQLSFASWEPLQIEAARCSR